MEHGHSRFVSQNVKVTVRYKEIPVYSGDRLGVLITFQRLGNKRPEKPEPEAVEESSWWSRRISEQFVRPLLSELEQEDDDAEESASVNQERETYLTGSVQLFGYFTVDKNVVDNSMFEKLKETSVISGCLGGIPSLKVTSNVKKLFLQSLQSNITTLLNSDISDYSSFVGHSHDSQDGNAYFEINPLYLTNQVLMFPQLTLAAGGFKQYYFQFQLPENLPSSYFSQHVSINYRLIINVDRLTDSRPLNINVSFPLKLRLTPSVEGYQVIPDLLKEFGLNKKYLNHNKYNLVTEIQDEEVQDIDTVDSKYNPKAAMAVIPEINVEDSKYMKMEIIETMKKLVAEKNLYTTEQIKSLPPTPQIDGGLYSDTVGGAAQVNTGLGSPFEDRRFFLKALGSARTDIGKLVANLLTVKFEPHDNYVTKKNHRYESLIKSHLKTQYLLKYKNKFIAKLIFNKPFYKVGEAMNVLFEFSEGVVGLGLPSRLGFKVSGLSMGLVKFEKFNYQFLSEYQTTIEEIHEQFKHDPVGAQKTWKFPHVDLELLGLSYDEINDNEHIEKEIMGNNPGYWNRFHSTVCENKYSLLTDNYKSFNANDLVVPSGVTPQFSTNVFRLKYYIHLKFILIDELKNDSSVNNIYLTTMTNDHIGILNVAKDSLNGVEFSIKIPVNILPSDNK